MELKSLKDRVAIVTGGSKGIGRSIVRTLLEQGANVLTFSRGEVALRSLEIEAERTPGTLAWLALDAREPGNEKIIVSKAIELFGRLDILINNLGGTLQFGGIDDLQDKDFHDAFDLNVMTFVRFTREAIPELKKSPNARIINISSISGSQPGFANPHYSLTKAATINLSKYFANILSKHNILVNVVCPGPVISDLWEKNVEWQADKTGEMVEAIRQSFEQRSASSIPLGRVGTGEDISGLVAFLASDHSSWITGSCFHVSGGKIQSAF